MMVRSLTGSFRLSRDIVGRLLAAGNIVLRS